MPLPSSSGRYWSRPALRASLLLGLALDIIAILAATGVPIAALPDEPVPLVYRGALVGLLLFRGAIQVLACYDLERFRVVFGWLVLSHLVGGVSLLAMSGPGLASTAIALAIFCFWKLG